MPLEYFINPKLTIMSDKKTVKDRLKEFLKEERISNSEFSRRMGLSPAYIGAMRRSLPEDKVERMMELFPYLNRDWLLYGEGNMYRDLPEINSSPKPLVDYMVPLLPNEAFAGRFSDYAEGVMLPDCEKIIAPVKGVDVAIRVSGDSMEPNIANGTILCLKKFNERSFIPWGNPLVLDTENGALVKVLYPSDKGEDFVEAQSYNPKYPPFQIPRECIYHLFRIVAQMKVTNVL